MKTIVIDDRKERKRQHLTDSEVERLNSISKISENLPSHQELEEYSLLAIHESLLKESNLYNEIVSFAKKNDKLLILFSGGITQNSIFESGKIMKINSAEFYHKIIPFLSNYSENNGEYPLLKFLYGEEWRLPLLFRYKNLLWKYGTTESSQMEIQNNEDANIEEVIRDLLMPDSDSITLEWVEKRLTKYRETI